MKANRAEVRLLADIVRSFISGMEAVRGVCCRRLLAPGVIVLPLLLSGCFGDTEYVYYDDAAITAFSIGTLNCYYTWKSSTDSDSIVKKTMDCSSVVFHIDHANGLIWNTDSLPIEVDASKVLCTVVSRNSGPVGVKSLTSDSVSAYSSTDSLDFTAPREFQVYSTSGQSFRKYMVSVNVHQEEPDTCIWTLVTSGCSEIGALETMKALSRDDRIYLFGNDGVEEKVYTTTIDNGVEWTKLVPEMALSAGSATSATLLDNTFYIYSDGYVLRSEDAVTWDVVCMNSDIKQLLGASTVNLYALSRSNELLMSSDQGQSWTVETLDDDSCYLPTEDLSFACRTVTTNANTDKLVLIGNRSSDVYPADSCAVVWSKVDEYGSGSRHNAWNYVAFAGDNYVNRAPKARNWQVVNYDENNFKAVSGAAIGMGSSTALDRIYHSGDDGITWRNDSVMVMPDNLSSSDMSFAFVADTNGSVWLLCGDTGQVWKARINRVAWTKEPEYFLE